jgi:hypothetical protein
MHGSNGKLSENLKEIHHFNHLSADRTAILKWIVVLKTPNFPITNSLLILFKEIIAV